MDAARAASPKRSLSFSVGLVRLPRAGPLYSPPLRRLRNKLLMIRSLKSYAINSVDKRKEQ